MTWSLGETEALAKKAANGAGFSPGEAEEAGCAVRWLCARDIGGSEALAALLTAKYAGLTEDQCPIGQGTRLCDGVMGFDSPPPELGPVVCPIILLPFTAWSASQFGWNIEARFGDSFYRLTPDGHVLGEPDKRDRFDISIPRRVALKQDISPTGSPLTQTRRVQHSADAVKTLKNFAAKTYAPITDDSRKLGAGAGLVDND